MPKGSDAGSKNVFLKSPQPFLKVCAIDAVKETAVFFFQCMGMG